MPEKVALIGPNPQAEGGTNIPFKLFCDYLNSNYSKRHRFRIIRSSDNSLNKSAKPLELFKESWRILRILGATISCDTLILFGSQRFATITGSVLVLVYKPLRRKIYIRYNGGGCDVYYEQSNLVYRWLMRRVLSHADAIVVETEMLQSNMSAVWGDKLFSAPNYRTRGVGHVQERLFRNGSVSFIYVGIVRKLKGLEELFRKRGEKLLWSWISMGQ